MHDVLVESGRRYLKEQGRGAWLSGGDRISVDSTLNSADLNHAYITVSSSWGTVD